MARVMVERSTLKQEPVDEHQPVLPARARSPFPQPGSKPGLVPFMPQRAESQR